MANTRRNTNGLKTQQVKDLDAAWHHAARIGRPLNKFITFRPPGIDEMQPADRAQLFAAIRNKLGVYARTAGFEYMATWSREIERDGTGEHMHVLMHVPARHREHFDAVVRQWLPDGVGVDVRTATQRTRFTWDGRQLSAIRYISKQMTPQAAYGKPVVRKAGGTILGKRGGVTANIDWRARQAAFRAPRNPFAATNAIPVVPDQAPEIARSA